MAESKEIKLTVGGSEKVFGLTVSFGGAVPVHYRDRPPAGSVILDFAFGDDEERVVWMDSDWSEPHERFEGFVER